MTNLKNNFLINKFSKIRFLLPIIIGILLTNFLLNNPASNLNQNKLIIIILAIWSIVTWLTIHYFRMEYNKKFREKHLKIIEEEMKKPGFGHAKFDLYNAIFLAFVISAFLFINSLFFFFKNGLLENNWRIEYIFFAILTFGISFFLFKFLKTK